MAHSRRVRAFACVGVFTLGMAMLGCGQGFGGFSFPPFIRIPEEMREQIRREHEESERRYEVTFRFAFCAGDRIYALQGRSDTAWELDRGTLRWRRLADDVAALDADQSGPQLVVRNCLGLRWLNRGTTILGKWEAGFTRHALVVWSVKGVRFYPKWPGRASEAPFVPDVTYWSLDYGRDRLWALTRDSRLLHVGIGESDWSRAEVTGPDDGPRHRTAPTLGRMLFGRDTFVSRAPYGKGMWAGGLHLSRIRVRSSLEAGPWATPLYFNSRDADEVWAILGVEDFALIDPSAGKVLLRESAPSEAYSFLHFDRGRQVFLSVHDSRLRVYPEGDEPPRGLDLPVERER
ncbi:MAG: hypothetical protein HYY17_11985 [Planctomycetes bacterium]|nr:hypothetical protein [Planctomycetota bacterium]